MASLKRKQTLFSGVARKAKEIRQNSTNLAFNNKTLGTVSSKIATADTRRAIYVFYLSMGGGWQFSKVGNKHGHHVLQFFLIPYPLILLVTSFTISKW